MDGVPKLPWRSSCGAGQERVAPGAVLRPEPELFERVGLQGAGPLVVFVGEQHVVEDLDHPAVVPVVVGLLGHADGSVGPPIAAT